MKLRVVLAAAVAGLAIGSHPWETGPKAAPCPGSSCEAAAISRDQAIARAVNRVSSVDRGIVVSHPRHRALFTDRGVRFRPSGGGPSWRWRLASAPAGVETGPVRPLRRATMIDYPRGGVIERYVLRSETIEQQFVLPAPLHLDGRDLVLGGDVRSTGRLRRTADGWLWQTGPGAVSLGGVTVLDANGGKLSARMRVTRSSTRIVVDGRALATAAYPVTVDPEIGANDFRISDAGKPDTVADAEAPAVAYNPAANEYLVVWEAEGGTAPFADGESEIFAQRLDAATGAEVGPNDIRISDVGPDGNPAHDASTPAVAYNPANDEYLIVWSGDDTVDLEAEIFGQRLTATGTEIAPNDFRISDMGPDGNTGFDALAPAVAHNAARNEYLVVWSGDDDTAPLVNGELEIFGQRLNAATGAQVATNDFRISDMGPNGNASFDARDPAIAHNPATGEYVVVWEGDDNTAPLVDGEDEIFAQRLSGTGAQLGANDLRISGMGPDGNASFDAADPAIAVNTRTASSHYGEYFVVWEGDDHIHGVDNELEIYGEQLTAAGTEPSRTDRRITRVGPDDDSNFDAGNPAVTHDAVTGRYLLAWEGDHNAEPLIDNETEIFARMINDETFNNHTEHLRVSDAGANGSTVFEATKPAVAGNAAGELIAVWGADDDTTPLVDNEFEIYAQRLHGVLGKQLGANEAQISTMGAPDTIADASFADVAYNARDKEYLIVWSADDNVRPTADGELEIYGQRVDAATGAEVGINDFRISDIGPDGDGRFDAAEPAVAYDETHNEYLVVWTGDDSTDEEFEVFAQRLTATGGAVGANDLRISEMGAPGSGAAFIAATPAVAYNPSSKEYVVVWEGDDAVDGDVEIHGQRIDAGTGSPIGADDFRISDMGPDQNASFGAFDPAIAYNPAANEYLVAWRGEDDTASLVDQEFEIFGQRLNGSTAEDVGANDFRISNMGTDGTTKGGAADPAIAYNPRAGEYLVVWAGNDATAPLADGEFEIYGQRLDAATGAETGVNDFRISDMGPDGTSLLGAFQPAVAYDPTSDEYLVVWVGHDDTPPLVRNEFEIFGQRLTAATGAEAGVNDARLSQMGPDGASSFAARAPAVAGGTAAGEYLVVWHGEDDTPPLLDEEFEIFGQRIVP